ncbi:winged helix-turn-helix domain-containing protein [Dokdonella sp.]|uniref:winged helix-turn-helix domain-containing protein n=1 Tax=Dokdonella sp. TaxID=2291710 RepID=UPI00262CEEA9|nr:winged helix-turn-helix domain-containing protein [Dokdonella sp.]
MIYRFDDFLLNPATRELRKSEEPVVLPARAFDCLVYLVEHRERAVGRDELIAAVWGRTEISEALLSHTVLKLRRGLGDTGNEQRTVRTVPRFGYRWGPATTVEAAAEDAPPAAAGEPGDCAVDTGEAAPPSLASPPDSGEADAVDIPPPSSRRWRWGGLSAVAVVLLALWGFASRPPRSGTGEAVQATAAMPVLVLPAEVGAADDWRWLRFGLMDLVANRLRDGAVPTTPSESVVGLVRQRPAADGDALLRDASLAQVAALRVLPRVRQEQGQWQVRLDVVGAQRTFDVEARADDVVGAGRAAADALLQRLGRAANEASPLPRTPALDELLQHTGAAMLADQLDQARELIAHAPPELQRDPRVEQRMAQIELRAGDYEAVGTRLQVLLDRLGHDGDAALRARAMLTLAASQMRRGQPERALELYDEVVALRRDQGDHEALGVARLGRGAVLGQRGRFDEATAELSRARTELEAVGDGLAVASVDVNLGGFQLARHRPADAAAILKNAVRQFERLGAREGRAYALAELAAAESELLDHDGALATSERFWPPESNTSNQRMRWTLVAARARALYGVGRVEEAQALVDRLGRESDPKGDALARSRGALLVARMSLARGDAQTSAALAAAAATPALRAEDAIAWTRTLLLRTQALRVAGRVSDAAEVVETLRAAAGGDEWATAYAQLADAGQAEAEGRRALALDRYAEAMRGVERLAVPEDLVVAGTAYVDLLIEASQLDAARAVGGRIAMWADRDARAATAQVRLLRALGQDDAARRAEGALLQDPTAVAERAASRP